MDKHRGDTGTTSLYGGVRVEKDDITIEVCGNIDELSASLGVVRAEGLSVQFEEILLRIQQELIAFCAEIVSDSTKITSEHIRRIEAEIDHIEAELPKLTQFIIPGGDATGMPSDGRRSSALLHLSRTICRRAERSLTTLCRIKKKSPHLAAYLNRLGGLLFIMARKCTDPVA